MKSTFQIAIVGGGAVGLFASLLLAQRGHVPVVVRQQQGLLHGRSVALMASSVDMLKQAGMRPDLEERCTPLKTIRIVDAMGRLFKAPTVSFHANETGLDAFAMNIENNALLETLETAARRAGVVFINGLVSTVHSSDLFVTLAGDGFEVEAQAVIAADGRHSIMAAKDQFERDIKTYNQSAVTAVVEHSVSHSNVSTEFHTPHGPLTFVPAGPHCSAVVWVMTPGQGDQIHKLNDAEFNLLLAEKSFSFLGPLKLAGRRGIWPIEMSLASPLAKNRIYLTGEAAHTLPPIGAQGLNLGLRDAQCAAHILSQRIEKTQDVGATDAMEAYQRSRENDVKTTARAVDALNRSLLLPFLPVHIARGFGLFAAQKSRFVRNRLMQSGLGAVSGAVR